MRAQSGIIYFVGEKLYYVLDKIFVQFSLRNNFLKENKVQFNWSLLEKFVTVRKRRNTYVHVKVKHFILPYRQLINILLLSTLNTFVSCIELTNLNYHYFRIDRNNAIGYMSDIHLSDSPTNILSKMLLILKKKIFDLIIPILAQIIFLNIY